MSEKIHLEDSLFNRHGLKGEGFCSDLEFGLVVDIVVGGVPRIKNSFTQSLFKACFVSADLTLYCVDRVVEGVLEGFVLALTAEQSVSRIDGNFKINVVALSAEVTVASPSSLKYLSSFESFS